MKTTVPSDRQRKRRHSKRLTHLGEQIARVAHEINAPTSLVMGSLEQLQSFSEALTTYIQALDRDARNDEARSALRRELRLDYVLANTPRLLKICQEGTARLGHIVEQLAAYTRSDPTPDSAPHADLDPVVRTSIDMARHSRRGSLPTIEWRAPVLPEAAVDPSALGQVLSNLIANACDAVESSADAKVTITARLEPDPTQGEGAWLELSVRDNGPGIAADQCERIFEPFFTTKPRGVGLGLGLAISRELIQRHGGSLRAVPRAEAGAEFVIQLRAAAVGMSPEC